LARRAIGSTNARMNQLKEQMLALSGDALGRHLGCSIGSLIAHDCFH